jgi:hypothetical protein
MCCAALKCIWSQMIMDGAEEKMREVEKSGFNSCTTKGFFNQIYVR